MNSAVVLHFRGGSFDVFEQHCGRMWRWFIKLILTRANLVLVQGELVQTNVRHIRRCRESGRAPKRN